MIKILLFILIPFLLFGQIYVHDVQCDDNNANTIVSNDGLGSDWVASHNTDTFYNAENGGQFALNTNAEYIKSADNWTAEKLTITWGLALLKTTSTAAENHLNLGNGNNVIVVNEFILQRPGSSDEWKIRARGAAGGEQTKTTTGIMGDQARHEYRLIIDASISPWSVVLYIDDVLISWGAWDGDPAVAEFNSLIYYGDTGGQEPDGYVNDILIRETVEDADSGYPDWSGYSNQGGYK